MLNTTSLGSTRYGSVDTNALDLLAALDDQVLGPFNRGTVLLNGRGVSKRLVSIFTDQTKLLSDSTSRLLNNSFNIGVDM